MPTRGCSQVPETREFTQTQTTPLSSYPCGIQHSTRLFNPQRRPSYRVADNALVPGTLHPPESILAEARLLETHGEALQSQDQSLIANNQLGIAPTFHATLFEYDYRFRETWNQPMPTSSITRPQYRYNISTTPALVASMIWARQVSLREPSRNNASVPRPTTSIQSTQ